MRQASPDRDSDVRHLHIFLHRFPHPTLEGNTDVSSIRPFLYSLRDRDPTDVPYLDFCVFLLPFPGAGAAMIVGLLVAAGHGRRFDPTGARSKLEARFGPVIVAVRTAQPLLDNCDRVIAAVRPDSARLADDLAAAGCEIAVVTGEEGMGNSIACGARVAARLDALRMVLVQPADMPWLGSLSVRQLVQAAAGEDQPIVVPTFQGHDGHPVRFDRRLLPELTQLTGERGARQLLLRYPTLRIAVDDVGVVRDLDTPEDLELPPAAPPEDHSPTR